MPKKASTSDDKPLTLSVPNFPQEEDRVLAFWEKEGIFQQTLEKTKGGKPFVFFEGPPTANGKPGIHHVLARAFKDVIVRFQTMRGRFVARKAGWDTHGLPVELQVEKALGISGKKQIENIVAGDPRASIAEFNARCKESVTEYIDDWQKMTRRIGFWLDMENAYRTYANPYVESLWWVIKQFSETKTDQGPLLFKGHKVVQHCPRCETALSSHEVAQGYKTVKDTSVYVKFRVIRPSEKKEGSKHADIQKLLDENKNTVFILSWTTTPWTLPGNVALAVGKDIAYVFAKKDDEVFVVAKERLAILDEAKILLEVTGEDLAGLGYEKLFEAGIADTGKVAWTVLLADFVTTTDGTGVVHTAVMYGEDDYQLGKSAGLPMQHTVSLTGHFVPEVKDLAGMFVKGAKTEKAILDGLHEKGLLFKVEPFSHEYPFCWRCGTPLLYYAKDSWFVRMTAMRKQLLKNANHIQWIPPYIKDGRFGEWLKEVKDWAFSRERYWGTPLPIWVCESCGKQEVIGSFADLKKKAIKQTLPEAKRRAWVIRHGESERNIAHITNCDLSKDAYPLTEKGKKDVEAVAKNLKGKVDFIVASPFQRTRMTAEIIAKATGATMLLDSRLKELQYLPFEGRPTEEITNAYPNNPRLIHSAPPGCETLAMAGKRVEECVTENLQRFTGKRVLFVSHGDPLWAYQWMLSGKQEKDIDTITYPEKGKLQEISVAVPINPHRPYIDDIKLRCSCKAKGKMSRVEEVVDVWFDSGAMPFAQAHYPFDAHAHFDGTQFPADYISEAIDQTRGWFYTLLAVSTALGKEAPYKNVICLGHILDDKGEKMSKSKGNIVNPWTVIHETGADALRFHLFSLNQPGDAKAFSIDGVREVVRKTFMILWNVESFFLQHVKGYIPVKKIPQSSNILDKWMLNLLAKTTEAVTKELESFHVFEASRALRDFVTELSTWYLRRSRERLRDASGEAAHVLAFVLEQTAILFAPFCPMFAESIFQRMHDTTKDTSVHLLNWPEIQGTVDEKLMTQMQSVRDIVELALAIRKEKQIKIRQPLEAFAINQTLEKWQSQLIFEEINVKRQAELKTYPKDRWASKSRGSLTAYLDVEITQELREEGKVRDLLRHINDIRKLARLSIEDSIVFHVAANEEVKKFISLHAPEINQAARISRTTWEIPDSAKVKREVTFEGLKIQIGLSPVA